MKNSIYFLIIISAFSCSKIKEKVKELAPTNSSQYHKIEYNQSRKIVKDRIGEIFKFEDILIQTSTYSSKGIFTRNIIVLVKNPEKTFISDSLFLNYSTQINKLILNAVKNKEVFDSIIIEFQKTENNNNISKTNSIKTENKIS